MPDDNSATSTTTNQPTPAQSIDTSKIELMLSEQGTAINAFIESASARLEKIENFMTLFEATPQQPTDPVEPTPEPTPQLQLSELVNEVKSLKTQIIASRSADFGPAGGNSHADPAPALKLSEDKHEIMQKQGLSLLEATRLAQANKRKNAAS